MRLIKIVFLCSFILAVCLTGTVTNVSFAQTGSQTNLQPDKQKKAETASPQKEVVIGHLQTRDKIVTISKGQKGTAYTVKTKDGTVLNANLNEKDFQAKYPDLYHQIKNSQAGNDATLRKGDMTPVPPPHSGTVRVGPDSK